MIKNDPSETMDLILANICHLHHARGQQLFESLGLYRGQPPVLKALWEQEGLTQTELAERLHNAPATMTKMLQRMEKAGFIQRRPDASDQRVTRVYLTDTGRAVQNQVEQTFRTMDEETFANLSVEDCVLLRRFLLQIRENLIQAAGREHGINR